MIARLATLALGASLVTSACSASSSGAASYEIAFPSIAAAVAVHLVQVTVFDSSDCATLVESTKSGQPLPSPLISGTPTSPCDLAAGKGGLSVSNGTRALLAVATQLDPVSHMDVNFLIGCSVQSVADGATVVPIPLSLFDVTRAVPATKCTTLSQHCSGGC